MKFAECMRANGVKDFPAPDPDGPLIDTSRMPGSPAGRSIPGFQAAQEKCRDFMSDAVPGAPAGSGERNSVSSAPFPARLAPRYRPRIDAVYSSIPCRVICLTSVTRTEC
jgi:hypothetical protein